MNELEEALRIAQGIREALFNHGILSKCDNCDGRGEVAFESGHCWACNGSGVERRPDRIHPVSKPNNEPGD